MDVYKEWLGIPEGPRPPDHYELLRSVRFEDDADRIRKHYKKLNSHVRKYASGQFAAASQELLNELAKAMLCLTDPTRKRDYDESLGREFPEEAGPLGRKPLQKRLVETGAITREQMREAEKFADVRGLSLRDAVVQMKLVDVETASQAYAAELGLPYLDLSDVVPDDSVLDRLSRDVVKRNSILPLFVDDDMLLVACVDEPGTDVEDELRMRYELPMRAVIATPLAVNQGIAKYYAPGMRDKADTSSPLKGASAKPAAKKGAARPAEKKKARAADEAPQKTSLPRMADLSEGERRERRQKGIIFLAWGLAGPMLVDEFVIRPYAIHVFRGGFGSLVSTPFFPLLSLVAIPAVLFWVLRVYWK